MTTTLVIDTFFCIWRVSTHEALHCNLNMSTFFQEIAPCDEDYQEQLHSQDLEQMNGMYVNLWPFK